MKRVILAALVAVTAVAFAEGNSYESRTPEQKRDMRPQERPMRPQEHVYRGYDRDHRPHPQAVWREGTGWVLPALILGGIFGAAIAQQPAPVIVQPAPVVVQPGLTYRYVQAYDESCTCWKQVLIVN